MRQSTSPEPQGVSDDLGALLEEARALRMSMSNGTNNATITVQAGGLGVIIATGACVLMLAINIMQLVDRTRLDSEVRELRAADKDHDNHLSAIYMMAPHLKPEEKK